MDWSRLSPLPVENIYHVAAIVADFDRALEEMGRELGITWAEPRSGPGGFRATYSRQGPPYLEIMQGVSDPRSVFTIEGGPRFHHVGIHVADWAAEVERRKTAGWELERQLAEGLCFMKNGMGLRFEIVDVARREWLWEWLHSEPEPPPAT